MLDTIWNSSNTRIVVDSSSNVPLSLQAQYRMIEVPTLVNFGTESFRNNVDLPDDVFYERLAASDVLPTTSQPPPTFFADAYRQAFDEGAEHILVITVTQKLSGTFASSQTAIRLLDRSTSDPSVTVAHEATGPETDDRIVCWDGDSISLGSGWQAVAAARLLVQGIERAQLIERLDKIRSATIGFATLDTLKYAARSGRISNLQASIGNLLHVKAILEIDDGLVSPVSRVRGRKRSLRDIVDRLCAKFDDVPIRIGVMHANAPDDAQKLAAVVQARLHVEELLIGDIGPAIASFGGQGAIGLVGYPSRMG